MPHESGASSNHRPTQLKEAVPQYKVQWLLDRPLSRAMTRKLKRLFPDVSLEYFSITLSERPFTAPLRGRVRRKKCPLIEVHRPHGKLGHSRGGSSGSALTRKRHRQRFRNRTSWRSSHPSFRVPFEVISLSLSRHAEPTCPGSGSRTRRRRSRSSCRAVLWSEAVAAA
jgi:hypothetical protein